MDHTKQTCGLGTASESCYTNIISADTSFQVLTRVNSKMMVLQVMTLYTLVNRYLSSKLHGNHILEHQSLTIHEILPLFTGCNNKIVFLVNAIATSRGSEGKAALFLTSAIDGCEQITSCPSCFTHGTKHLYPLNRRLGGPHSHAGPFGEQIYVHLFALTGFKPQTVRPAAKSLYWLHYPGSCIYWLL